jgi:hypothetical protein
MTWRVALQVQRARARDFALFADGAAMAGGIRPFLPAPAGPAFGGAPMRFKNLGSTCYINAVLQAPLTSPDLVRAMRGRPHSPTCGQRTATGPSAACVLCQLEQLVLANALGSGTNGPLVSPRGITNNLSAIHGLRRRRSGLARAHRDQGRAASRGLARRARRAARRGALFSLLWVLL